MNTESVQSSNLIVQIKDPDQVLFEGGADMVSSINKVGKFDVLLNHANFISIIKSQILVFQNNNLIKELKIGLGVLRVINNKVNIYITSSTFESGSLKA